MLIKFDYTYNGATERRCYKSMAGSNITWQLCRAIRNFAKHTSGIYNVTRDGKVSRT